MKPGDPADADAETAPSQLDPDRTEPSPDIPIAEATRDPVRGLTAVGRYLILRPLGAGGMGVVYLAYDPQLDRKVALKLIRADVLPGKLHDMLRARMMREAQAMARLSHPNVVSVYDAGSVETALFVAMERVDGPSLDQWLRERERPQREILRVLVGAGRGLAAAHRAGLLHRDFKPDNVIVAPGGVARVTDFGLARRSDEPDRRSLDNPVRLPNALETEITPSGVFVGTPGYISPELVKGQPADARSDQFSYAVTLYEALYGAHPFGSRPTAELLKGEAFSAIRVPTDSRVAPWIRRILIRGLALEPGERWPSMDAMLEALERDPRAIWRRVGAVAAVAGVIVASIAGGRFSAARQEQLCRSASNAVASAWNPRLEQSIHDAFLKTGVPYAEGSWTGTQRALSAYADAWVAMRTEACEATHVRGEQSAETLDLRMECLDRRLAELSALTELLSTADAKTVERSITAVHGLSSIPECADAQALRAPVRAPRDPAAVASLAELSKALARAKALRSSGRYQEGLGALQPHLAEARALDYAPALAEVLVQIADLQEEAGDARSAVLSAQEAALVAQRGHDDALASKAWDQLAFSRGDQEAHYDEGRWYTQLAEAANARLGGQPELQAELMHLRGIIDTDQGRFDEAIGELQASVALREKANGPDDPGVAIALNTLGNTEHQKGDTSQALALHQRVLDIDRRILDPRHPSIAVALQNLGEDLADLCRPEQAAQDLEQALTLFQASLGPEHPWVGIALANLGRELGRAGELHRALETESQGVTIVEKSEGADSPTLAETLEYLGEIHAARNDYPAALTAYSRALAILQGHSETSPADLATPLAGVGQAQLHLHGPAASLPPLQRALGLTAVAKLNPLGLAAAQSTLAQALWAQGDHARATELAQEAIRGYQSAAGSCGAGVRVQEWLAEVQSGPAHR